MSPRKRKANNTEKADSSATTGPTPDKDTPVEPSDVVPGHKESDPLQKLEAEREEYKDRLQRSAAEFSNYQKRSQREKDDLRKYAASPIALELLGVLDNFHRAIQSATGQIEEDFLRGFQMIEEHLQGILEKHGVEPIEALNQAFDPNFHDALLEEENAELPDKTIVEELEKGYMLHDRLLRPTRVKVSRQPTEESSEEVDGEEDSVADEESDKQDGME